MKTMITIIKGVLNIFKLSINSIKGTSIRKLTSSVDQHPILFTLALSDSRNEGNKKNIFGSSSLLPKMLMREDLVKLLTIYKNLKVIFIIIPHGKLEVHKIKGKHLIYLTLNEFINWLKNEAMSFEKCSNILQQTLLMGFDISWEQLVNILKENGFYLSGGHSTKRHIISTTHRRLCKILDILGVEEEFTIYTYHNSEKLLRSQSTSNLPKRKYSTISIQSRNYSTSKKRTGSLGLSKQTIYFEYSPLYEVIKNLIEENKDLQTTQKKIEVLLNSAWIDILKDERYKGGMNSEAFSLLHKHIEEFNDCLEALKEEKLNSTKKKDKALKPLFELDLKEISVIVFNNVLPILQTTEGKPRNQVLMQIGEEVYHRWALDNYKLNKTASKNFQYFYKSLKITATQKGNLGDLLLHYLLENGNLVAYKIKKSLKKQEGWIIPSEKGREHFNKYLDLIGFKLPMIVPPVRWNPNKHGGYLTNNINYFEELIHSGVNNVTPTIIQDQRIYDQVNAMSRVAFKINKKVLNTILQIGVEKGLILESLHLDTENWNNLNAEKKQSVLSHNSRYYQEKNILGIATLFQDVERIYFPLFYDWRGRVYTSSSYLTYQGNELAKALLIFADGGSFKNSIYNINNNGLYWLKI